MKNKKASLSAFTQKRLCLYELHYTPEKNICQSFFEKNQLDKQVEKEYIYTIGYDIETVLEAPFTVVTWDSKNPYRQMYVAN